MGKFASTRLSTWVTRLFVWAYNVDLSEATRPLAEYDSLEDLFTRELRAGVRPIDTTLETLVSPVDGTVAYQGTTTDQRLHLDAGQTLHLSALLGLPQTPTADNDQEYDVVVLYLSPTNYHRVHVPREGVPVRWRYVPGTLWPVFPAAVRTVRGLFQKNERAIVEFDTDIGPLHVVFVGAFGVGRISLTVCDLVTNTGGAACEAPVVNPAPLQRGDQLGVFHLGSTVVLASPPGTWDWTAAVGASVQFGQPIARVIAR